MVVAGVGMDHDKLVDLCRRYFVAEKKAIWEENKELSGPAKPVDKSVSQYTGGILAVGFLCRSTPQGGILAVGFRGRSTPRGESLL